MTPSPASSPTNFQDWRVAVVGASRGIGLACTEALLQSGASVLAVARSAATSHALTSLREGADGRLTAIDGDVSDADSRRRLAQALKAFRPHGYVAVAAKPYGALAAMTSSRHLRDVFEVNFFAQIELIQGVARSMYSAGGGSIVTISSVAALDPLEGTMAYASSKAALTWATMVLAAEMGAAGVRANVVAPGPVSTDMLNEMDLKSRDALINRTARGEVASPNEVADAVLFLLSDAARHISGSILRVDGGRR